MADKKFLDSEGLSYFLDKLKEANIKGDKGDAGKDAKIASATATATGTHLDSPTVEVEVGGETGAQTLSFTFTGLQGAPGDAGPAGPAGPPGEAADVEELKTWVQETAKAASAKTADTATKLTGTVGTANKPVWIDAGTPKQIDVVANASWATETATARGLKAQQIPNGTDLNTLTTMGTLYYTPSISNAATMKNTPFPSPTAFCMLVLGSAGATQLAFNYEANNPMIDVRNYYNPTGTWGEWKQVYPASTADTLSATLPINKGGTGQTTRAAAFQGLAFLGMNPIASTAEDGQTKWLQLGTGYAIFTVTGRLNGQPSQYGFVLSLCSGSEVHQIWLTQTNSKLYHRGGNGSNAAAMPGWTEIIDSKSTIPLDTKAVFLAAHPVGSYYWSETATSPQTTYGGTWVQIKDRFVWAKGDSDTVGNTGGAKTVALTTAQMPSHTHTGPSHTHGLNGHTHSVGAHAHGLNSHTHSMGHTHSISHTHKLATSMTNILKSAGARQNRYLSAVPYEYEVSNGTYNLASLSSGEASTTVSGAASYTTTGAASGNTANSAAFNTGGNTGNTTAAGTGATGSAGSGSAHENMPPYVVAYCWKRTA